MAEDDFETVEVEVSEDDILYYLFDEQDQEIGFVVEEDGKEVEYFYEWVDIDAYEGIEAVEVDEEPGEEQGAGGSGYDEPDDAEEPASIADLLELDGETVEMEIDEDAIDHYLFDAEGNEIGFVILEDGVEVECYYQEDDEDDGDGSEALDALEVAGAALDGPADADKPEEHGYLYKMAQIAGHEGNKARKKAEDQLGKARDKASPKIDAARSKAEAGIDKATEAVESGGKKLKAKSDEYDLDITRDGVAEATADLNAIAKEGAETAKELKEAYDDIMDSFGFLMPKSVRRKLP